MAKIGRPPKSLLTRKFSVKVSPEVYEALERAANAQSIPSKSELVDRQIRAALGMAIPEYNN